MTEEMTTTIFVLAAMILGYGFIKWVAERVKKGTR